MIRSCRNPDTKKLVDREFCKKFSAIEKVARLRLDRLNATTSLKDLAMIPGHRLEKSAKDRAGQCGIRINEQYRVFSNARDTWNVEICAIDRSRPLPA